MKRLHLILLFIVWYSLPTYSQWYPVGEPYHTQHLRQHRRDSTDKWQNSWKDQFAFDARSRRNRVERYGWINGRWRIGELETFEFDNNDRIIFNSNKYWQQDPYELQNDGWRRYQYRDGLIIRSEYFQLYVPNGETNDGSTDYRYDAKNQLIEVLSRYRRNDGKYYEYSRRNYFDANQCEEAISHRSRYEGENWRSYDSTHYYLDAGCEIDTLEEYTLDPATGEIRLFHKARYLRDYDSLGNLNRQRREYYNPTKETWVLSAEDTYDYDPIYGLILEQHLISQDSGFFGWRYRYHYQLDTLDYLNIEEYKNPNDSSWIRSGYQGYRRDEAGNIIYEIQQHRWISEEREEFFSQERSDSMYDEENRLEERIIEIIDRSPGDADTYLLIQYNYSYRCDGEETQEIVTTLDSNQSRHIGSQTRYFTSYLMPAFCAEAEVGSSLMLWPNPAQEYLHISYPAPMGFSIISITDPSGKTVLRKEQNLSNYFTLDLSTMVAGSYILKIESESVNDSQRFVVVK